MRLADRLLLISLSFMILAGCSSGTMDNIAGGTMAEFELTCSINSFEPTKASMSGLQMQWSAGDVIIISAGGKTYPFSTVSGGPVAVFKGRLPADSGQIFARFEASVEAVQNGDPSAYIPCSASADLRVTKSLDFSPEVALVRIQVDREDIRYIQITGNGEIADGSKAVRRMPDSGRMLEPGNVYVVVRPEAEGQLTVVAVSDRGEYSISLSDISAGDCRVVSDAVSAWTNNVADGPARYIFIQTADWQYNSSLIAENFGPWDGKDLAVGEAAMFYIFERPITTLNAELRNHLEASQRSGVPIFVELDPITFWDDVPELWNWFDPSLPGYDPDNRENVEWTSWSSEDAVKIGWLNWGRQIRLKPMANLFSPAYQAAVRQRMGRLLSTVSEWYEALPDDKKYLLAGIKIIGEFGFGVNNWYYPDGNKYYDKDPSGDPLSGITRSNDPSWGVQQMGYAALSYSGIKTSGTITASDIVELERAYVRWLAGVVEEYGFPREVLFAHAGSWNEHLSSCIDERVCPSWSWYSRDNISSDSYIMGLIRDSSAPWWGVAEWAIGSGSSATYKRLLGELLSNDGCRFVSIFENVVGDNGSTAPNQAAVTAIQELLSESGPGVGK